MTQDANAIELGKKICLILSKQDCIGDHLNHSYQGGGNATHLKIVVTQGNEKFLKAGRKFLTEELKLSVKQEPKHGKGGKNNTFLVPLFGIKEDSLKKINFLSQEIIRKENPSNGKIIRYDKPVEEIQGGEEVAEKIATTPTIVLASSSKKREMYESSKYRISLSHYLRPIMEMEGITPSQFPFDQDLKNMKGGMITVICQNEEIASMVERSIAYNSKDLVVRDGLSLIIDGSKFCELEHKPFAFPPKGEDSHELAKKRVQMIFNSKLDFSWANGKFIITFGRKITASKALKILKDLGWKVDTSDDDNSIVVWAGYAETKESDTIPGPAPIARVISNESPSDEGILKELEFLMAAGNLSSETMERIQKAIMDNLKKSNPEEYAKILLAKLGY